MKRVARPRAAMSPQRATILGAVIGGILGVSLFLLGVFCWSLVAPNHGHPPSMNGVPPSGFDKLGNAFGDAVYATVMLGLYLGPAAGVVGVGVGVFVGMTWGYLRGRKS